MSPKDAGDYSIGSNKWNGMSKLLEEMGELQQVLAKIMAINGSTEHWDGDLRENLKEELGDVRAALAFFNVNMTDDEADFIHKRSQDKFAIFTQWDMEARHDAR